jgi:Mrp family chromosome partitioning ATPase
VTNSSSVPPANDLRHYLTQRISASDVKDEWEAPPDQRADLGEVGPVLVSVNEVIDTVLEGSTGELPRTMLVAGTSSRAQSPPAAIAIARSLSDRYEQVALVDLAKGAAVVSGQLNMPRVPGFADLAAGSVDFSEVVKIDEGSTLQVICSGNPMTNAGYYESDKFMRVFEALTQTYDCVVLHADMAAFESLMPALKFELPVVVAVLPPRETTEGECQSLSILQRLGCPIVIYGTGGKQKQRRFSLFGRKAAV